MHSKTTIKTFQKNQTPEKQKIENAHQIARYL